MMYSEQGDLKQTNVEIPKHERIEASISNLVSVIDEFETFIEVLSGEWIEAKIKTDPDNTSTTNTSDPQPPNCLYHVLCDSPGNINKQAERIYNLIDKLHSRLY